MLSTKLQHQEVFDAQTPNKASSFSQSSQTAAPGLGWRLPDLCSLSSRHGKLDHLTTVGYDNNLLSTTSSVNHHYLPQRILLTL